MIDPNKEKCHVKRLALKFLAMSAMDADVVYLLTKKTPGIVRAYKAQKKYRLEADPIKAMKLLERECLDPINPNNGEPST